MSNNSTTTFLNVVLAVIVLLSVGFGMLAVIDESRAPQLTATALQCNSSLMKVNAVLNDAIAYNATAHSPELTRIIQAAEQKPAAH